MNQKHCKKIMLILFFLLCCLTACTDKKNSVNNTDSETVISTDDISKENSEDDNMTREVNTVIEISDYLYIKRLSGEVIKLDLSYNNDFKVDDWVYVSYDNMTENEDGTYSVNLKTIHLTEKTTPDTSNF